MASKVPQGDKPTGTPTSLLLSIVCTLVVFALAEIQSSFALDDAFSMRTVLMSYVGLGLTLAFFWKRLEKSIFLKLSSGLYLFGLWVSLFVSTLAPVLIKGDSPLIQNTVFQQVGFGFVVLSGISLMMGLLQGQKMSAGLVFSSLGAALLVVTSGGGFFVKPSHDTSDLISSSSHGAKKDSPDHGDEHGTEEGEEIVANGHGAASEHGAEAEHGDVHAAAPHGEAHALASEEKDEHHGAAPKAEHSENAAPAAKIKLSAKAPVESHEDEHHAPAPVSAAKHGADDSEKHEPAADAPHTAPHAAPAAPAAKKAVKKIKTASLEHAIEKAPAPAPAKGKVTPGHENHVDWDYAKGDHDPAHWGALADNFRKCSVGKEQSPIDIPSAWPLLDDITLDYKLTPLSIVDNGHTIQFNVGPQNFATIAGRRYNLVQFHIHTPSEHWIDGKVSPMEIHFVHKDEKNKLAVIGVMVEEGKAQKAFGEMWQFVPQSIGSSASPKDQKFNIASMLPGKPKVYRYRGSLTTPPCSENVLWSVASEKITFSADQIEAFKKRYKLNARPVQKQDSRLAH